MKEMQSWGVKRNTIVSIQMALTMQTFTGDVLNSVIRSFSREWLNINKLNYIIVFK